MKRHFTLLALLATLVAGSALAGLLAPHVAAADCSSLPSSLGTTSLTLNVVSSGTYRVWVREMSPNASTGGFYLQIPDAGACQITMGNASVPADAWTWVDYQNATMSSKVDVNLSAGNHPVTLAGLNSGVEVDRLLLLSDPNCIPTGDGSNCTASAATSATSTPSGSPTPTPLSSVPGNANAPIAAKSSNPIAVLVAAAGRFRNPLLFAGSLIISIPLLWFVALHLGLIHPVTAEPSSLDLAGQPKPHSILPVSATVKPDHPAPSESARKPAKPKLPQLPATPPAPKPGSTTAPTSSPPTGAPHINANKD